MRAKVAKHASGHALEERFLKLDDLQLFLLYTQAVKEEKEEKEEKYELIKTLNTVWSNKFDHHFELLRLFTNKEMFKRMKEMEEIDEHKVEINEDNFVEEWDRLMQYIPEEYTIEEGPTVSDILTVAKDDEFEELLTGWVESSKKFKEER